MFIVIANDAGRMARMRRVNVPFTLLARPWRYAACASFLTTGAMCDLKVRHAKMAVVPQHLRRCLVSLQTARMLKVVAIQL